MGAFISAFLVPKAGSTAEECEDATAVVPTSAPDEWVSGPVLAAVSDGASESLLSRDWANLLANAVLESARQDVWALHDRDGFAAAVLDATGQWEGWLTEYLADRKAGGRPVRWYEQPKLDRGAYATVLAAHFDSEREPEPARWYAAALGDTCLFQVRRHELVCAFPVSSASDFNTVPALVNSRMRDRVLLAARAELVSGPLVWGDQFYLCTDALAAWFLEDAERGGMPWVALRDLSARGDADSFAAWVAHMRATGGMRNDDVALVHVDLG